MLIRRHVNHRLLKPLCAHYHTTNYNNNTNNDNIGSTTSSAKLVPLTNRSLIQVSGRDSKKLLQGLITNDLNLLEEQSSIYSMLLNTSGRILYDMMVYKRTTGEEYTIECDCQGEDSLIELLKRYKLRSKVKFTKRTDLGVFYLYHMVGVKVADRLIPKDYIDSISYHDDPRVPLGGIRVLTDSTSQVVERISKDLPLDRIHEQTLCAYKQHRYRIGISEGADEIQGGIPLEHNLAWLNGVSFTKGCYIGQELVARTHHTGVIRKRVVPLTFPNTPMEEGEVEGESVVNEKGRSVGKVLGRTLQCGIGLMRLKDVMNSTSLHVKGTEIAVDPVQLPAWWPAVEY